MCEIARLDLNGKRRDVTRQVRSSRKIPVRTIQFRWLVTTDDNGSGSFQTIKHQYPIYLLCYLKMQ